VKLRQTSLPEEITEVQKRIKFIVHRMDSAIANHEFEKARFYSTRNARSARTCARCATSITWTTRRGNRGRETLKM